MDNRCKGYLVKNGKRCTNRVHPYCKGYCRRHDPVSMYLRKNGKEEKKEEEGEKKKEHKKEEHNCAICFSSMIDTPCTFLPCFHKYHRSCMVTWDYVNKSCPNCHQEYGILLRDTITLTYKAPLVVTPPIVDGVTHHHLLHP